LKTLILTPTQKEFDFFLQSCTRFEFKIESSGVGRLPVARLRGLDVTLARGGAGKAQFAVHTQHLLDSDGDWNLVICAGGAGGLVDEVSVGDVVVATATVEHDYTNRFSQRPLPRFESDQDAITALRGAVLLPHAFKIHFGPVASGDEDVIETERRRSLQQSTGALAVAWEGAGGARACAFSNVPFVEIRGVTDAADHDAPADYDKNLEVAMSNVAEVITSSLDRPLGAREVT
jgi:adenosylhomocysteine nucleosidase